MLIFTGLEDLVKPLPPGDASTVHTRILGVAQNILDSPDDMSANGPRQCAIITSASAKFTGRFCT